MNKYIGKKVIVRCDRSGVFYGTLVSVNKQMVELSNFRKLFYWDGAAAIEQLSVDGVSNPKNCKFTISVESGIMSDMIQIIPCTEKSINSIDGVKEWKM